MNKICSNCRRSPGDSTAHTCPYCPGYRPLVLDLHGKEEYEVCTQCGRPPVSRGDGQCTGNHKLPTKFVWLNAAGHAGLTHSLAHVLID